MINLQMLDGSMADPAVLHSLIWLQMLLHSPRPFKVLLNSLLTKSIGEHGMESSTREQNSTNTLNFLPGGVALAERAGRACPMG